MRWVHKYFKLSSEEKKLLLEALLLLFYSKILLYLPFRIALSRLTDTQSQSNKTAEAELIQIRQAIRRANKLAYWKNICLVKSFAARFMLQRRGIASVMYFGLRIQDDKKLVAHAWLLAEGVDITPMGNIIFKEIFKI